MDFVLAACLISFMKFQPGHRLMAGFIVLKVALPQSSKGR
jgi:hypothetical protein